MPARKGNKINIFVMWYCVGIQFVEMCVDVEHTARL